jgi:hypothetical protein
MENKQDKAYEFNWRRAGDLSVSRIEGPGAEEFFSEYHSHAQKKFGDNYGGHVHKNEYLDLKFNGTFVTGSNPFSVVLANEILRPHGIRTATPRDIETIIESESLALHKGHIDTALVLREKRPYCGEFGRSDQDSLAESLGRQLDERGIYYGEESPIVLPLTSLRLEATPYTMYGLGFLLRREIQLYPGTQLTKENNGKEFSRVDKHGLPIFEKGHGRYYGARSDHLLSGMQISDNNRNIVEDDIWESDNCEHGLIVLVSEDVEN